MMPPDPIPADPCTVGATDPATADPVAVDPATVDWIAVDWGTTHLRAYAIGQARCLARAASAEGMAGLTRAGCEPALLRLITGWLAPGRQTPVVACGMVGSRQGWREAPYRTTPCAPLDPATLVAVPTLDRRLDLRLVPGLCQTRPADVMRGEETQVAGALAVLTDFDGVLCLPGTHSKWVHVSAAEVVSFQTCMTGELFALLAEKSVLRHACEGEGWDEAAFVLAVADAIARPEKLAARLFALRAESLIAGLAAAAARARLSGLLIGIELAAARPYWLGQDVVIVGTPMLAGLYQRALATLGVSARSLPVDACTIAGLTRARGAVPCKGDAG
ncbi:MAG: 2-dehydro-3-deoxygalactonokinase [Pseudorhodobacter sp.]|nr:2-dehydro-3-deoxygalactonokinase [Pseudorhodobacter sp.]